MITDFSSIIAPRSGGRRGFGRAEADRVAGPDELLADAEAAVIQVHVLPAQAYYLAAQKTILS
jgi:hypothetical protein